MEPQFILGTAQLASSYGVTNLAADGVDEQRALEILEAAHSLGVKAYDTAPSYPHAEQFLGQYLKASDEVTTKIHWNGDASPSELERACWSSLEASMTSLRQEKIHCVLTHSASDKEVKQLPNVLDLMTGMKEQELVAQIGLSVYDPSILLDDATLEKIDVVQIPANIFDRRFLSQTIRDRLQEKHVKCIARSLFLQGSLLQPLNDDAPLILQRHENLFASWFDYCDNHDIAPVKACLDWARGQSVLRGVICGAASASELEEQFSFFSSQRENVDFVIDDISESVIDPRKWT